MAETESSEPKAPKRLFMKQPTMLRMLYALGPVLAAGLYLRRVYDAAKAGLGTRVTIGEGLSAVHHEGMGRIPCPWGGCGTFQKGEVELTDTRTGEMLRFTALSIHLIGAHEFFQGCGSRYRIEPDRLHRMLASG